MSVSVIIPAYKAAHTIGRAVESALAQSVPAAEIVVVDDGSPDDIAAALAPYGERVTLLRKANGRAASARNMGIERATGDFMAFLDADDYWEPEKLERQLAIFQRHPEVGLVAGRYFTQPPGSERTVELEVDGRSFDRVLRLRGKAVFRAATSVWTGTVIVRREVLGAERFVSGLEPAEDRDLWVRLIAKTPIYLTSQPLATAVLEAGSTSRSSVAGDCSSMLKVVRRQRSLLGFFGTRMWESHTYYRWAALDANPASALGRLALSFCFWPLPYQRSRVRMAWARPKLFAISLLRLARRRPRQGTTQPAGAGTA
jgi:glycosyltransferase involved in cell wall biosynthesis